MRSSFCTLNKKTNMWYVYCQWLYVVDLSSGDNNKLLRNYCLNFLLYSVCARVIPHTQADSLCPMYECVCERGGETNAFLCVNLREGVSARDLLFAIERESLCVCMHMCPCVHAYPSVCIPICVCMCIQTCCMLLKESLCVCMHTGPCVYAHPYMCVWVYTYRCMHTCLCMYTCLGVHA